jgi:hypothetical protein
MVLAGNVFGFVAAHRFRQAIYAGLTGSAPRGTLIATFWLRSRPHGLVSGGIICTGPAIGPTAYLHIMPRAGATLDILRSYWTQSEMGKAETSKLRLFRERC